MKTAPNYYDGALHYKKDGLQKIISYSAIKAPEMTHEGQLGKHVGFGWCPKPAGKKQKHVEPERKQNVDQPKSDESKKSKKNRPPVDGGTDDTNESNISGI